MVKSNAVGVVWRIACIAKHELVFAVVASADGARQVVILDGWQDPSWVKIDDLLLVLNFILRKDLACRVSACVRGEFEG